MINENFARIIIRVSGAGTRNQNAYKKAALIVEEGVIYLLSHCRTLNNAESLVKNKRGFLCVQVIGDANDYNSFIDIDFPLNFGNTTIGLVHILKDSESYEEFLDNHKNESKQERTTTTTTNNTNNSDNNMNSNNNNNSEVTNNLSANIDFTQIITDTLLTSFGEFGRTIALTASGPINKVVNSKIEELLTNLKNQQKENSDNAKHVYIHVNGSEPIKFDNSLHAKFEKVLKLVQLHEHIYLYGPAGTGKSTLCKQVAKALNLEFYSTQKVLNDYELTGFVDANGNYVETQFYKAITKGGLFMFDEIDASNPEAVAVIHTALANKYITFPKIGKVEVHKDFKCISTGNTVMNGATSDFVARTQLDAATIDRFGFLKIEYDNNVELKQARGDKSLVEFIHEVREVAKNIGLSISTGRSIEKISNIKNDFTKEECLEIALIKGMHKDNIVLLANNCTKGGDWLKALKNLAA